MTKTTTSIDARINALRAGLKEHAAAWREADELACTMARIDLRHFQQHQQLHRRIRIRNILRS